MLRERHQYEQTNLAEGPQGGGLTPSIGLALESLEHLLCLLKAADQLGIAGVVVGPRAEPFVVDVVKDLLSRYELDKRVRQSSLLYGPIRPSG